MTMFWHTGIHRKIEIFVTFHPGTPQDPAISTPGTPQDPQGGGVNIRIYVHVQLQGTYKRVCTATGPGEPFRHTERSI